MGDIPVDLRRRHLVSFLRHVRERKEVRRVAGDCKKEQQERAQIPKKGGSGRTDGVYTLEFGDL